MRVKNKVNASNLSIKEPSNRIHKSKIKSNKPFISNYDIHLFHEGTHYKCYSFMGAHYVREGILWGVRFTTWAPNCRGI